MSSAAPRPTTAAAALVGALAVLPAGYLLYRASEVGGDRIVDLVMDDRTARLLGRTALLAFAVSATAVLIGVPLAWLLTRTDLPARRVLMVLANLPLAVPSYVVALAIIAALGPRGAVARWFGLDSLPSLYGFGGAWLCLSMCTFPYVVLTASAALRRIDPALEEASRSLGIGTVGTFRRVTLPLLRPAIAAGALLVALYTLADFGAPSLMRFDSFTRVIHVQYVGGDRSAAAVYALVLIAFTSLLVAGELRTRTRAGYVVSSASRVAAVVRLGRWRWAAFVAVCGLVLVSLVLPVSVLVSWLVFAVREGSELGFAAGDARHSVTGALLAAAATVVAAWPVAVLVARHPGRAARWTERATYVGYSLPGLVLALSLVFLGVRVVPGLYQTLALLVFAYVVLFLPQALGSLRTTLLQVSPRLEEVSRSLGAGPLRTALRVTLPLMRPGLLAAGALVFLTAMKELPAAVLLAPIGWDTLATRVWGSTSEGFFGAAAIPALVLIGLSSVPLTFLSLRSGGGATQR